MQVTELSNGICIKDVQDFYPDHIFECGQAFRWDRNGLGYTGVVGNRVVGLFFDRGNVILKNTSVEEYELFWKHYFDLDRDYGEIKSTLSRDPVMEKATQFGWGIRILNQDPWETLISFIISANNNIARIKRIIRNLSQRYGSTLVWNGVEYFSFPEPDALAGASEDDLMACGCGYRARYIKETAGMVYRGEINLKRLKEVPYQQACAELLTCPGVGPKVADCILLFSCGKGEAFPVDVWIKRAMQHFYPWCSGSNREIRRFVDEKFGQLAGVAQQYLYYYARDCLRLFDKN